MSREQLAAEALEVAKAAEHNMWWIWNHPDRVDQSKVDDMIAYLQRMHHLARMEMKNARRAGRTSQKSTVQSIFSSLF